MSIFVITGVSGQIKTTALQSGDMAVAGPSTGPLEQIMFDICRWRGTRNADYGGWIIPRASVGQVLRALCERCTKIAN